MCQLCVNEGRMTQEEYDQERAAGNPEVFPMDELPPELAVTMVREVRLSLVRDVVQQELGITVTEDEAESWLAWLDGTS